MHMRTFGGSSAWLLLALTHQSFAKDIKFTEWFPWYGNILQNEIEGKAADGFANCSAPFQTYVQEYSGKNTTDNCYAVYDCVYGGVPQSIQGNFASAQVLLGLTPAILAMLAPSLSETSMLSSQRPLLASMISLGCPAVYIPRLLENSSPLETIKPARNLFGSLPLQRGSASVLISALQYLFAAASIANVAELSWRLGYRTVITWKCQSMYLPFIWSSLPLVMHLTAAIAWHYSRAMRARRRNGLASSAKGFVAHLRDEFSLSAHSTERYGLNHQNSFNSALTTASEAERNEHFLVVAFNEIANCITFVHLIFGTAVFSSMAFITVHDALRVFARYMVSGLLMRFILAFELDCMRRIEKGEGEHGMPLDQYAGQKSTNSPNGWTTQSVVPK